MRFVKIPAILSTATDPGCIGKLIPHGTGFSNNNFKKFFLTMHSSFVLFSLQFHEASTMVGLKMFETLDKPTLCEHSQ